MKTLQQLAAEFADEPIPATLRSGETPKRPEKPIEILEVEPITPVHQPKSSSDDPGPPKTPQRRAYLRSILDWMLRCNMITSTFFELTNDRINKGDTVGLEAELQEIINQAEIDLTEYMRSFHMVKHLMRSMRGLP